METRKPKSAKLELSEGNYQKLKRLSKKNGLTVRKQVNLILDCEAKILEYGFSKRSKLAKQLKIKLNPRTLLFGPGWYET